MGKIWKPSVQCNELQTCFLSPLAIAHPGVCFVTGPRIWTAKGKMVLWYRGICPFSLPVGAYKILTGEVSSPRSFTQELYCWGIAEHPGHVWKSCISVKTSSPRKNHATNTTCKTNVYCRLFQTREAKEFSIDKLGLYQSAWRQVGAATALVSVESCWNILTEDASEFCLQFVTIVYLHIFTYFWRWVIHVWIGFQPQCCPSCCFVTFPR